MTKEITPLQQLFIRACKSKDTIKRLNSIHRRFWLWNDDQHQINDNLIHHLAEIAEDHCQNAWQKNIHFMLYHQDRNGFVSTTQEKVLYSMINIIRYTAFENIRTPRRFKNA